MSLMVDVFTKRSTSNYVGITPLAEFPAFDIGQTRMFRSPAQVGTLTHQGARVNIWTINATDAAAVDQAMIDRFDYIVTRMEYSFAPFAGVRVYTLYAGMALLF